MVNNIQRPEKGFAILRMNPASRDFFALVFEQQECKKHIISTTYQSIQASGWAAAVSIRTTVSVHMAVVSVRVAVVSVHTAVAAR